VFIPIVVLPSCGFLNMNTQLDVSTRVRAAIVALSLLASACSPAERADESASGEGLAEAAALTIPGPCADVHGGQVCTFATVMDGAVTEFGATVPMVTIEAAPEGGEMVWPPQVAATIPLPEEVQAETGFDHLGVNWEAMGHPPGLFFTPHFDFHFYSVTPEAVAATDCSDTSKPGALPAAYALPDLDVPPIGMLVGLCVPLMGMHAMPAAEVDQTDPFGASMLVGYYGGDFTFIEPMVSKVMLLEGAPFELEVPSIPDVPAGVSLPTSFDATYDEVTATYRLTFSGLGAM
jgi:hypothetical protein